MLTLGIFAALGIIVLSGTKTGVALALAASIGPLGAYAAICAPLVFPFTLFVVLVPFDNLLSTDAFGTITRMLAIACGVSIVLWLIRTRRAIMPDRALFVWCLLAFWALATLAWAIDTDTASTHLFTLFQLLALYAAASFVPVERRALRVVLFAVICSGVAAAVYGIILFRSGTDVSANGRLVITNDENTIDPNQFAAALILPISIALVNLVNGRSITTRTGCMLALIVMGGGIAVSGSRGGLLGVCAVFLYVFFRTRVRLLAAGIGLGALSIALAFSNNVLTRFSTATATGGAGRVDIWRVGLSALREHLWFGAGFANFPVAFDQAFLSVTEKYFTHWHRAPHDILISTGVELGVLGLVLLLLGWWTQFRALRQIARADRLYNARVALEAALIGLFIASLFLDILTTKYLWLAFTVVMLVRNAAVAPAKAHQ